ncbi:MAG: hypothetical protein ACI8RZ_005816 [Myxococcota bacterium]|jgi:hypothetical protein
MLFVTLLSCSGPITNAPILEDQEYVDALPRREQHQLLAGGQADSTSEMEALAVSFNTTFEELLTWVEGVRALPPTERGEDYRIWGPHIADEDANLYWRVTIERVEPGRFEWAFGLRDGTDGDWAVFFSGDYLAGFDPSESQGGFFYDLDTLSASGLSDEAGTIAVEYDYIGEHELYADILQDGVEGDYWYREEDGLSSAWFALPLEVYAPDPKVDRPEDYAVAAQWTEDGAGRLESLTTGGDFETMEVFYTECWDDSGAIVYAYYDCPICVEPAEGDIADCVLSEGLDPTDPPD